MIRLLTRPVLLLLLVVGVLGGAASPGDLLRAQEPPPESPPQPIPLTVPLWDGRAPGALGTRIEDVPTLTVYQPRLGAEPRPAIVLAPGGGYVNLAMDHEGRQVAYYLNTYGVTVLVLKYRLGPRYGHPAPLDDIQRAIRTVRAQASEWGVDPQRVGVMGFSAGGHLASTASTHFDAGQANADDPIDQQSSRPDFAILGYPVISMTAPWTHRGSRTALLGSSPDETTAASLSNETQVTPATPPTFLFHTDADTAVPVENSLAYYAALREAGVPAELHVFKDGRHGVGLAPGDPTLQVWPVLLGNWLRASGVVTDEP